MYIAELGGITQKLQTMVGEVYTLDCAADLGDARCHLALASGRLWRDAAHHAADRGSVRGRDRTADWKGGSES